MKNRYASIGWMIIISLLINSINVFSVMNKSDSLIALVKTDKPFCTEPCVGDTVRVIHLLALVSEIRDRNPDSAMILSLDALHLSEKIHINGEAGWENGIGQSCHHIATLYGMKGDYSNSLQFFSKALSVWNDIEKRSTDKNMPGIKIQISKSLGNIGMVYWRQGDFQKALDFHFKALHLDEQLENKKGIARHLGNIGNVYKSLGDYSKSLEFEMKALKLNKELDDKNGVATVLGNIGAIYTAIKKYADAEKYLLQAIEMSNSVGDFYAVMEVNQNISDLYVQMGQDRKALDHFKKAMIVKETLFNEEKDKEIMQKTMTFEFEKQQAAQQAAQERKNVLQSAELQRQKIIQNASFAGLAGVIILVFILLYGFIQKRKANLLLGKTLQNLKSTQDQLVKSEKMAAFGVMASRVAHEIENPLNFVNNFSELSNELLDEISISSNEEEKVQNILLLKDNLEHINHHGKRADNIIKQLLAHTRSGTAHEFFEK